MMSPRRKERHHDIKGLGLVIYIYIYCCFIFSNCQLGDFLCSIHRDGFSGFSDHDTVLIAQEHGQDMAGMMGFGFHFCSGQIN